MSEDERFPALPEKQKMFIEPSRRRSNNQQLATHASFVSFVVCFLRLMGQAGGMLIVRQCWILLLLTLGGSVLSVLVGWSPVPWAAGEWVDKEEISVSAARGQAVLWVDARTAAEYAEGHEPGAIHLNETNWGTGVMELMMVWLEEPRVMVVYCAEAGCGSSKRLAMRLREAVTGAEVYWLKGGWEALQE